MQSPKSGGLQNFSAWQSPDLLGLFSCTVLSKLIKTISNMQRDRVAVQRCTGAHERAKYPFPLVVVIPEPRFFKVGEAGHILLSPLYKWLESLDGRRSKAPLVIPLMHCYHIISETFSRAS